MLVVSIPTDEELGLEEDENGTQQKGGMRASKMHRRWGGHSGFPLEKAAFSGYKHYWPH